LHLWLKHQINMVNKRKDHAAGVNHFAAVY
jgi:hypothetical protein